MNDDESQRTTDESSPDLPGTADETLPAVRDSFEPVPVRARHDGWTPARQRAFIEALAESFCIADAAAAVGMSPRGAYELRRRAGAGGFAALWDAVLRQGFRDRVRPLLLDKALNGTTRDRWFGFPPRGRAKDRRSRLKER